MPSENQITDDIKGGPSLTRLFGKGGSCSSSSRGSQQ
ncbi:hypothetical protein HNQ93_003455 [Hymenobacter luteus]|uniref:Uncharacterized protein n=2 Tax=Hymenobacter TaxID=89966 RepID=A0A7W9T373_9BACT|nr:hypothetical protein [Hymenobacter latericoloratus]MBB6060581.1 hypothetical protein [Hymenobacter luteus]